MRSAAAFVSVCSAASVLPPSPPPFPPPFPPPAVDGELTRELPIAPFDSAAALPTRFDPFSIRATSTASGASSIASVDDERSLTCFTFGANGASGVGCQMLYKTDDALSYGPDVQLKAPTSVYPYLRSQWGALGACPYGYPGGSASGCGGNFLSVSTGTANEPTVAVFDNQHAIVCYVQGSALVCNALRIGPDKGDAFSPNILSAGPPVTVFALAAHITVETWHARGADLLWAARSAFVCFSAQIVNQYPSYCTPLSLSFPTYTAPDGSTKENAEVAGTLTAGTAAILTPACVGAGATCANYRGVWMETSEAATALDYFNGFVCYTGKTIDGVSGGSAVCKVISTDVATGSVLTISGGGAVDGVASNIVVTAFGSKSGDPTRALYCYVSVADLVCSYAQRLGNDLTYLNSERDTTTGAATSGVRETAVVATGATQPTIAALDPYNMIVCYTLTATNTIACNHLWVTGYGSSTYNSPVFDGVASASQAKNVGSVQTMNVGPQLIVSYAADAVGTGNMPYVDAFVTWDVDNEAGYFYKAVVCYTDTVTSRPACSLLGATPLRKVWAFNADVDCVNGYGCPTRRGLEHNITYNNLERVNATKGETANTTTTK